MKVTMCLKALILSKALRARDSLAKLCIVAYNPMATKVIDRTIRLGQFPMTRRVHYFFFFFFFIIFFIEQITSEFPLFFQ